MTVPFEHLAEPYSSQYFLMSSIYPVLCILGLYLWFCLKAGPHFMRNRQPFELKKAVIVYNILQISLNAYCVKLITFDGLPVLNIFCQPVADASTPFGRLSIWAMHLGFVIRLLELVDTVMFVLRKKFNQVSRLHVYHHTMMVMITWVGTRYIPGGNGWVTAYLNSFVHVVMYSYYLWSAASKDSNKSLWWKKYITILQMVQFVVIGIHAFQTLFRDCNYPKILMVFTLLQSVLFVKMFGQFYINTYIRQPKKVGR